MSFKVIMPKDPIEDTRKVSKRITTNVVLCFAGLVFSIMGFALGVAMGVNGKAGLCLLFAVLLGIGLHINLKAVP